MSDLYETIVRILGEQLRVDTDRIKPGTRIFTELDADDLDMVQVITSIDDAFDIDISDEDAADIAGLDAENPVETVEELVKRVERYIR